MGFICIDLDSERLNSNLETVSYMKTVVEFCPYYGCICITIQEEIKFSNVGKHDILWDVATLVDRVIQKNQDIQLRI